MLEMFLQYVLHTGRKISFYMSVLSDFFLNAMSTVLCSLRLPSSCRAVASEISYMCSSHVIIFGLYFMNFCYKKYACSHDRLFSWLFFFFSPVFLFLYLIERNQFCMENTINNGMQSVCFLKVYFFLINKW